MFARFLSKKDKVASRKAKEIPLSVKDETSEKHFVVKLPKHLLLEHSVIFKKMHEKGEFKRAKEVELQGITSTGLEKIAEFITKGSVSFQSHSEAIDGLKAAYVYQVTGMHGPCSDFLTSAIERDNVCEVYEFASSYGFHGVEYCCLRFIDEHAEEVLETPGFLNLRKLTAADIVRRQTLSVSDESRVFRSVLAWGLNDCVRRGVDVDDELCEAVRPLMARVRFLAMSEQELQDPDVDRFFRLLYVEDQASKRRSMLSLASSGDPPDQFSPRSRSNTAGSTDSTDPSKPASTTTRSRSSTVDSVCGHPRIYESEYSFDLALRGTDDHPVRTGESFSLRVEVLKGRTFFLTGLALAFDAFVTTKRSSCLQVTASVTNVRSSEQRTSRGTFLDSSEGAELRLATPLAAAECDLLEVNISVRRAENVCPALVGSEVQIRMPDSREVAIKVTPGVLASEDVRSLVKSVKYFF